jgi:hypothetical protein
VPNIEAEDFSERMRAAISLSWVMFSRKVGNGLIPINKEASMQLQYAYVLQQLLPLITFKDKAVAREQRLPDAKLREQKMEEWMLEFE